MSFDDRKALEQGPLKILETMQDSQGASRTFETIKFPIRAHGEPTLLGGIATDITERERLIAELREAMATVKQLGGLLPICAGCKKIRDDKGYWNQIESYITQRCVL